MVLSMEAPSGLAIVGRRNAGILIGQAAELGGWSIVRAPCSVQQVQLAADADMSAATVGGDGRNSSRPGWQSRAGIGCGDGH